MFPFARFINVLGLDQHGRIKEPGVALCIFKPSVKDTFDPLGLTQKERSRPRWPPAARCGMGCLASPPSNRLLTALFKYI